MADKQTPLMRQYHQIKKKYPDTILLFRLGDFFETFEDDAVTTAKVCGITLTKRNNGGSDEVPLAGFPHHQLDNYLPKLVRAGYRVAVCEQLEDPKLARGIVRRDVVEVVTPGVAFNDKLLDTKRNNYLVAVVLEETRNGVHVGLAGADISTGEFFTTELALAALADVLETLQPSEILLAKPSSSAQNSAQSSAPQPEETLQAQLARLSTKPAITRLEQWIFEEKFAREALLRHFKTQNLKGFGIEELRVGIAAAGAMLHYVSESQRGQLPHLQRISLLNPGEYMALDLATKRNLEITFSMNPESGSRQGTLISILDLTETALGARMFAKWISRPLRRLQPIEQRQSAVRAFVQEQGSRAALRKELSQVGDIERLMSKISTGRATPRDVVSLKSTLARLPTIKEILGAVVAATSCTTLQNILERWHDLNDVVQQIATALSDEPPAQLGGGSTFREGFSAELDEIRNVMYSGKNWIAEFQERERQQSGIPSLKVGFNNVFGYYIEITNAHKHRAPEHYERRQTLANAERYTTSELKDMEQKILNAEERLGSLERELFTQLRTTLTESAERTQAAAALVAAVDCLQSFAEAATRYHYVCPTLEDSERLEIIDGRHPVVERLLSVGESYTPNSTRLGVDDEHIHIITGPNMSGKSSYLRQVGLITFLAHIGSFVPAKQATVGLVDRIFTRVGAQDNITAGESTFLVEMQEAANILNNATGKSLILLDEVGRGTATFDGISIAWAIAEYLHNRVQAKTLFATHYHELTDIARHCSRIHNYKAEVQELGSSIVFTRHIVRGTADHSFGIHVATMAGLPNEVTERAGEILRSLEGTKANIAAHEIQMPTTGISIEQSVEQMQTLYSENAPISQFSLFEIRDDVLRQKLRRINLDTITPIQALQMLSELKSSL
jgi:DNA mismatch repair protein MutS